MASHLFFIATVLTALVSAQAYPLCGSCLPPCPPPCPPPPPPCQPLPTFHVELDNCGPAPSPLPVINAPPQQAPCVEKPLIPLPACVPAPKTIANTAHCVKTVVKPQVYQQLIAVPSLQRYLETTHTPVVENIHYNAVPINCPPYAPECSCAAPAPVCLPPPPPCAPVCLPPPPPPCAPICLPPPPPCAPLCLPPPPPPCSPICLPPPPPCAPLCLPPPPPPCAPLCLPPPPPPCVPSCLPLY